MSDEFDWFEEQLRKEAEEAEQLRTGRRRNEKGQLVFAPGNKLSGWTKGKKGSRQKLATSFFNNLYALWEEQGESVLRRAAFEEPVAFMAVVAKLMPQKIEISDTTMQDMESDRLERVLEFAERALEQGGFDTPALENQSGVGEAAQRGAIEILPPLPEAARVPRSG